ncbi:MAG: putative rane protein [Verrucomicrobiaceae bacterium]|nr:putative rane protein [Verrucomicrobiaceae bacterium]
MAKPYIEQSYRRSEASSYTFTWVLSALLVVFFALALAVYPPVFGPIKEAHDASKWILFFGRFHPLVVHLPIGVLIFSLLIEVGCLWRSVEEKWGDAALFAIFISAVGAVIGVIFGILLTREGGYEGGAFLLHQGLGIATAVGAIVALFLRLSAMSSGGRGLMESYRFVVLFTFGMMSIGAHFGGNMVHGSKYLTQYAPEAMAQSMTGFEKWLVGLVEKKKTVTTVELAPVKAEPEAVVQGTQPTAPPPAEPGSVTASTPAVTTTGAPVGPLVFQNVILPVLEAKCNKCHNADKSKGDLRMDSYELLIKGGQDDKVKSVVPGKPDDSLVLKRIALPNDDDEHMPPDGKDQTSKEEAALLRWWVQEGASSTLAVKDAKIPAELQSTVDALLKK